MSLDKFKKHLFDSISNPASTQIDWLLNNGSGVHPTNPTILSWASTDDKDSFEYLCNNSFETLKSSKDSRIESLNKNVFTKTIEYYLNNPIDYKLNEYQFRSDSFSKKESGNVFLGCSDTFGVGQHLEHTWPYILTKIRFPFHKIYNLGVPGSGSDTAFRMLSVLKENVKIKNIFHWMPFRNRFEIYLGNDMISKKIQDVKIGNDFKIMGYSTITPQEELNNELFAKEYIKYGLSSNTMRDLTDLKNILAIKEIANELGVNYYIANYDLSYFTNDNYKSVQEYYKKNSIPEYLQARDFQHMSLTKNSEIVSYFLHQLDVKNKNNKYI